MSIFPFVGKDKSLPSLLQQQPRLGVAGASSPCIAAVLLRIALGVECSPMIKKYIQPDFPHLSLVAPLSFMAGS